MQSVEELLHALLGADPDLATLKELLIERTEGNPFFVEEIVRTLIETRVLSGERGRHMLAKPVSSVQVPPMVQDVIASRIDRLPPQEKRLIHEASVIGKDVPFTLLHMISDISEENLRGHLANLQAAEFLFETRLFPDLEYTFKHALTHQVAYAGLLHDRRREIHARIMGCIEKLHSDRLARARRAPCPPRPPGRGLAEGADLPAPGRSQSRRSPGQPGSGRCCSSRRWRQ